jgi:hypothetical protein
LAVGFELGAAASLAGIIILDKTNKAMVWGLFILLTIFQMMANSYHAYANLSNYQAWIELFGLVEEDPISQKRILSIVSGAVLPIVALGFIKSLTDYIKPEVTEDMLHPPHEIDSTIYNINSVDKDIEENIGIVEPIAANAEPVNVDKLDHDPSPTVLDTEDKSEFMADTYKRTGEYVKSSKGTGLRIPPIEL